MQNNNQKSLASVDHQNQQQALGVIIQAVHIAQNRGVFNLNEAELLAKCVRMFQAPAEEAQPQAEASTEESTEENRETLRV